MTMGLETTTTEAVIASSSKHRQPQKKRAIDLRQHDQLSHPTTASPSSPSSPSVVQRVTSNRVLTRHDMVRLLNDLLTPLEACQSTGGARVRIGHGGAGFDPVAAELEGYARALWGLGPLLASEPEHPLFRTMRVKWVQGLINGTDPNHVEYWGDCSDRDQRLVEQAAISVSIALAPQVFWEPLTHQQKGRINSWLVQGNELIYPPSNWRYFRIINNVAMKLVGGQYSQDMIDQELDFVEGFVGPSGLPADGLQPSTQAYDYYTTFAIQYYSLLLARALQRDHPEIAARFRNRAAATAPLLVHLFAPDGSAIPFGRSMTYRFACAAFWAAVAYDELELPAPFTNGVIKGLLLRNIRLFTRRPEVFDRDGGLSVGWMYPTMYMSENYNSPQSPYWALKSFLVLALPDDHPFWRAREEPYPSELLRTPYTMGAPWSQVFSHAAGHTFLLTSGLLPNRPQRGDAAKYAKFAYSSAFGFSVSTGPFGLEQLCPDNVLALSDDERREHWVVRRSVEDVRINRRGVIRSTWRPWPDVEVITWLKPPSTTTEPFHTRVHKVTTGRNLSTCEGAFAISPTSTVNGRQRDVSRSTLDDCKSPGRHESIKSAYVRSDAGMSGIISVYGSREGKVLDVDSNSNLISARTLLPTLQGTVEASTTTWFAGLVFGVPGAALDQTDWSECWQAHSSATLNSVHDLLDDLDVL